MDNNRWNKKIQDSGVSSGSVLKLIFAEPSRCLSLSKELEKLSRVIRPLANPIRIHLLGYLREPHYLEEIASHLSMSHQSARRHVDQLMKAGLLEKSLRGDSSIVDYRISLCALRRLADHFELIYHILGGSPMAKGLADRPQKPCIISLRGPPFASFIELQKNQSLSIGNGSDCSIRVCCDENVQPHHADIIYEAGSWTLHNRTTHGKITHNLDTWVGQEKVILDHGDLVGVGNSIFLIWTD